MSNDLNEPQENVEIPKVASSDLRKIPLRTQVGMILGRAIPPNKNTNANRYEEVMREAEKMGQFGKKQEIALIGLILRKLDEYEILE